MSSASLHPRFDFRISVAYDPERKALFHRHVRRQLCLLALELRPDAYELRSNQGGIAVSGEITLHSDTLYVQVSQPATGSDTGILFRSCSGRRDYVGGPNHFASLDRLHAPDRLADVIRTRVRF